MVISTVRYCIYLADQDTTEQDLHTQGPDADEMNE